MYTSQIAMLHVYITNCNVACIHHKWQCCMYTSQIAVLYALYKSQVAMLHVYITGCNALKTTAN